MKTEIDVQKRGDFRARLLKVTYGDTGIMSQKQFTRLVKDDLCLSENDLIRLLRVSGFSELKTKDRTMRVDLVQKNIEDRVAQSAKTRDECVRKVARLMKDQGMNIETAMHYFDDDRSGTISRNELNEGFKRMKVALNEQLIKNLFVILD
mmetsp:Transcript_5802/g.9262  ORF Transcript_5802/g.9262 Transcript_5802/m.9262 type:complete len:150 (+) Transcript_5802:2542-2991(+)